jgi:hypothetical protein
MLVVRRLFYRSAIWRVTSNASSIVSALSVASL